MKAVQFREHGGRDVITYDEYGDIEPGRDEVRIEVKAGALNHLDVWTRRGLPGLDLEMPHILGSDAAGVVESTGEGVTRFEEGDRVAVLAGVSCGDCEFCRDGDPTRCVSFHLLGEHVRGVHAEYPVVPADNLVPVPEGVDWETAAAAPWYSRRPGGCSSPGATSGRESRYSCWARAAASATPPSRSPTIVIHRSY
jgi:NADPH2:quinone reductase